jgi:hypothetical protein
MRGPVDRLVLVIQPRRSTGKETKTSQEIMTWQKRDLVGCARLEWKRSIEVT